MVKFKLIMFLIYLATIVVACFKLKKDLDENYEKEKHADVYESHMRMFKEIAVLRFQILLINTTLLCLTLNYFFGNLIDIFF